MMSHMASIAKLTSILLFVAAFASGGAASEASHDPLVVIVAATSELREISLPTLRRAFTGTVAEAGGQRLIPLNAPSEHEDRVLFDRSVLGMLPDEIGRFWVDQRIRGKGQAPRVIANASLAVRVVAALPGGIAYVRRSSINASVQVLAIEGHLPGDRGYLLDDD